MSFTLLHTVFGGFIDLSAGAYSLQSAALFLPVFTRLVLPVMKLSLVLVAALRLKLHFELFNLLEDTTHLKYSISIKQLPCCSLPQFLYAN